MPQGNDIAAHSKWTTAGASRWISRLFFWVVNAFPAARRLAYGALFDLVAAVIPKAASVTMMNYGFAELDDRASPLRLEPSEESERYSLQLYDRVAGAVGLRGLEVLDVSCGRGGGCAYMLHHLGAQQVTGLDSCRRSIDYCRHRHAEPGLTFVHGDAEAMPFVDESFDAVVNIESSFCYPDMDRFLSDVRRVLKPGSYFAFADLRHSGERPELLDAFKRSGLVLLEEADITQNVRRALTLDGARRARGLKRLVHPILRQMLGTYAGVQGSRIPTLLERGEMIYLRLLLRKPTRDRSSPSLP